MAETSDIKRRISSLEAQDHMIRALFLRMLALIRHRKINAVSRKLSDEETDIFRKEMAAHGVKDETPDPKTKWPNGGR